MSQHTEKEYGEKAPADADRNVDQIRDILFGGQMRDYERRFAELAQRLEHEAARMREDLDRRFAALDARLDEQIERLGRLVKQESADRARALDDLESRIQQAARTQRDELNAALAQLVQDLARNDERGRQGLASLSAALDRGLAQADAALTATRAELRGDKVGREDLSALFTELSLRLNGEFELPARKPRGARPATRVSALKRLAAQPGFSGAGGGGRGTARCCGARRSARGRGRRGMHAPGRFDRVRRCGIGRRVVANLILVLVRRALSCRLSACSSWRLRRDTRS